jgi:hypothetical protein
LKITFLSGLWKLDELLFRNKKLKYQSEELTMYFFEKISDLMMQGRTWLYRKTSCLHNNYFSREKLSEKFKLRNGKSKGREVFINVLGLN